MDLLAINAQLLLVNGAVVENGAVPGLQARPAPPKAARGREKDFLFTHLTLSGPAEVAAELAGRLVEGLGERFFNATGSVTSALRRAVIETNEQLLRGNVGVKSPHEGALSCAVLHGDELYTLQVGEGLAFLGHNFGVERLPVQRPQHQTPLGRSAGIDIRFAYHRLQSGDMLLLADPRLAHLTGETLAPALVDNEIESGLEALVNIVGQDSARLLLVEFTDELPSTLPFTFQHSKKPAVKSAPAKKAASPAATPVVAAPAAQPVREARAAPPLAAPVNGDGAAEPDLVAGVETSARRAMSTSARGLSRGILWVTELIDRLRPARAEEPAIHWAIPATIAVLIPVIIAAVITSVYIQRGTVNELTSLKQQMVEQISLAEAAAGDLAVAQTHYNTVLELAVQAEELRLDDPDVERLRAQAIDALDLIDGVERLSAATFYRHESGTELGRVALRQSEGGVIVLDQAGNRVLFHDTDDNFDSPTTEAPAVIAFGGQAIGAQTVGPLFDLLWQPGSISATRDSILAVDQAGGLFSYYPNFGDVTGLKLANSSEWVNPVAVTTYLDRLYVMDTGAGQIWKYYASANYDQLADDRAISFSGEAGLDQAVDFDIFAEDASMVVIYRDGRIRYYDTRGGRIQWDDATLQQRGLSSPLIAPTAVKIVGSGLNASIYVLDSGSGRIIQFSQGGTVLAQIRVLDEAGRDILSEATDFAVSVSPFRLFVVSGNGVYRAER